MTGVMWPGLPDDLSFDAFDDEDQILDFINSLEPTAKRIFLDALDKSSDDTILYARTSIPEVHVVLMKFTMKGDSGLVLLLSRNVNNIYSYFERLKEQTPDHVQYLDNLIGILVNQIRTTEELINKK